MNKKIENQSEIVSEKKMKSPSRLRSSEEDENGIQRLDRAKVKL